MALVLADRVQETSTSTGTGSFTLAGAVTGYQTFAVIGNGNTCYYTIADQGGANWEVGIGTYSTTGPTLARTTVLSNSNGNTSPVDFPAGTKTVFVTYPSEKSVNLDSSGNVSALGTVSSGTWQGSTVGVAYGGTGVTASSGANSVVLRDANQNISVNSVTQNLTKTTSAGGTTVLTAASSHFQVLTGTSAQTYQLPDATSLPTGSTWVFDNDSTQNLTVVDNASGTVDVVAAGGYSTVFLEANGTVAGEWGRFGMIPAEVNWGTNSLDLGGSTVVTNGVWQGTAIAPGYGGTGLTTFTAANYALYSTSSSALTAGTLPVAAGGTGVTTSTGSGNVVLSTSPTLVTPALGTPSSGNLANCTGYPGGSISGTVAIANGGTGQTTAGAAFNALSPITTTGDLIIGNGSNSATRLGIGSSGQVLTANGTTATWEDPASGGGTVTTTDFTATASQTVFTVNYTVGATEVYQNGVKLGIADYTATNGTSITLATGATAGDLIEVVTFSSLNLYSTITYEDFSGTGSQTVYTMSAVPANSASLLVAISGVVQDPGTYTVSSTTLTFLTAPPAGSSNISVRYLGIASIGTVGSFSGGTTGLTPASATTGAVVLGGTLNVANGGTGATTASTARTNLGLGTIATASASDYLTSANPSYTGTLTGGTGVVNIGSGQFYKDSSGNVGIGTASPSYPLDVLSNSSAIGVSIRGRSADNLSLYNFTSNNGATQYGYILGSLAELRLAQNGANYITAYTNGTERMRIDSSGNVGIGTTSPLGVLDVVKSGNQDTRIRSSTGGEANIRFQNTTTGTAVSDGLYIGVIGSDGYLYNYESANLIFATSSTERMRITSSGGISFGSSGTAYGTSGQVLTSAGNAAPTWTTINSPSASQLVKAWVNWTGNSSINASYNVSSITKGGTGNYTINFTSAFADTAYCETQGTWEYQRGWTGTYTKNTGSFQFEMHNTSNGAAIDMSYGNFAFFR